VRHFAVAGDRSWYLVTSSLNATMPNCSQQKMKKMLPNLPELTSKESRSLS